MKYKYVEEEFSRYHIFGEKENGLVDVASCSRDVVNGIPKDVALKLIKERDDAIDRLCETACAFDNVNHDAFSAFWYPQNVSE